MNSKDRLEGTKFSMNVICIAKNYAFNTSYFLIKRDFIVRGCFF